MHSNITSSYAYGIIKKNGFLTGEHRAENLTVLVLILVLCLNGKTKNAPYSGQIQALLQTPHDYYSNDIWMEYRVFFFLSHKNHLLFSTNCIRLTGGPVGIAPLKKSPWRNSWPLPNLCTQEEQAVSLTQVYQNFSRRWKQKSFIVPVSMTEASGCPLTLLAGPGVNIFFFGGWGEVGVGVGRILLGVPLWVFQEFFQGSLGWRTARKLESPLKHFRAWLSGHPPAVCRN